MYDFSNYESPISTIMGEIQTSIENDVYTAVQSCSINVNKEELVKALNYDRKQYEEGFRDGYNKAYKEMLDSTLEEMATRFSSMLRKGDYNERK